MSWKQQSGSKRNRNLKATTVLFDNSNFWERGNDMAIYNLNDGGETRIGVGTKTPFSRLSFGNTLSSNDNIYDNSGNLALCEMSDGTNATGIGFYEEFSGTNNLEYTGIKFVVNKDSTTATMNTMGGDNVKMLLTNDGRLMVNKDPRVEAIDNVYRLPGIDVSGNVKASKYFILDKISTSDVQTSMRGGIYYDGNAISYINDQGVPNKLQIVGGLSTSEVDSEWTASTVQNSLGFFGIYKKNYVNIWDIRGTDAQNDINGYYENAFGVAGAIVSGVNHEFTLGVGQTHKTGAIMKTRVLSQTTAIDISNQGIIVAETNLGVNSTRLKAMLDMSGVGMPYIAAGNTEAATDLSGEVISFGNLNRIKAPFSMTIGEDNSNTFSSYSLTIGTGNAHIDKSVISGYTNQDKYNFVMGNDNTTSGMGYSMIFGTSNGGQGDSRGSYNIIFGSNNATLDVSYCLIHGENHRVYNTSHGAVFGYGAKIDTDNNDYIFTISSKKKMLERGTDPIHGGNIVTVTEDGDLTVAGNFRIEKEFQLSGAINCADINFLNNIYIGAAGDPGAKNLTSILKNVIDLSLNRDISNIFFTNSFNGIAFSGADISCNIRDSSNNVIMYPGKPGSQNVDPYITNPFFRGDIQRPKNKSGALLDSYITTTELSANQIRIKKLKKSYIIQNQQQIDTGLYITATELSANTIDISGTIFTQDLSCNGTGALTIPVGNTSQRPTGYNGQIRYNTQTSQFEGYSTVWQGLGGVIDVDQDTKILAESTPNADNDQLQFITAGIERMVVDSNGKVGIGTTGPSYSLHVNASDAIMLPVGSTAQRPTPGTGLIRYNSTTSQFEGYSTVWQGLGGVIDVDQDTKILAETSPNADNDQLQFITEGTQKMIIDSNGNVGIGTNNPSEKLTVKGHMMIYNQYDSGNYTGADYYQSIIKLGGNDYSPQIRALRKSGYSDNVDLEFWVSGVNAEARHAMTIAGYSGNGNVGIGTSSPAKKMTIEDSSSDSILRITRTSGTPVSINIGGHAGWGNITSTGFLSLKANDTTNNGQTYQNDPQLFLDINGRVGIKTPGPESTLHVNGDIKVTQGISFRSGSTTYNGTHNNCSIHHWGVGPDGLQYNAFRGHIFTVNNGVECMRILGDTGSNSGYVGIGTASPATKLHIATAQTPTIRLENTDTELTENQEICKIEFKINDSQPSGTGIAGAIKMISVDKAWDGNYYGENADMRFCVGGHASDNANNNALTIQHDGNVGIGTTSPTEKLQVNGCLKIKQSEQIQHDSTYAYNGLVFENTSSLHTWYMGYRSGGDFTIGQYNTSSYNERFFIESSNGNVGIGTSSPQAKLNIHGEREGDLAETDGVYFSCNNTSPTYWGVAYIGGYTASNSTNQHPTSGYPGGLIFKTKRPNDNIDYNLDTSMVIDANGYVGIGTTSPQELLTVGNSSSTNTGGTTSMSILGPGENADAILYFGTQNTSDTSYAKKAAIIAEGQTSYSRSKLHFCLDNTANNDSTYNASISNSRMTIERNGNVGIGTTSPSKKLHAYTSSDWCCLLESGNTEVHLAHNDSGVHINTGSTSSSHYALHVKNSSNPAILYARCDGNVGIGTASPLAKLHIKVDDDTNANITEVLRLERQCDDLTQSSSTPGEGGYISMWNYDDHPSYGSRYEAARITWRLGTDNSETSGMLSFGTASGATIVDRMKILQNGNVGIGTGTNNPGYNLEIKSTSNTGRCFFEIKNDEGVAFRGTCIEGLSASGYKDLYLNWYSTNDLLMCANGGGNVGIGITNPGEKLQIRGHIKLENGDRPNVSAIIFEPTYYVYTGQSTTSGSLGEIQFRNQSSNKTTYMQGYIFSGSHIPSIRFLGKTAWNGSTIELMTLRGQQGRVGIGTTSPRGKLDVDGGDIYLDGSLYMDSGSGHNIYCRYIVYTSYLYAQSGNSASNDLALDAKGGHIYLKDNGSVVMTILNNSRVAIGRSSASYKLHVSGDVAAYDGWLRTNGSRGWYNDSYGGGMLMQDTTWVRASGNKDIFTGGRICCDGYMGAGTSSPSWPFHSAATKNQYYWWSTSLGYSGSPTWDYHLTTYGVSIYSYGSVFTSHAFLMYSDQRIKKNIREIPDEISLKVLRDISCVYYTYIDKSKGHGETMGFIAQQVREHIPMAVTIEENVFIPDENRILIDDITWETVICNKNETGVDISYNSTDFLNEHKYDASGVQLTEEKYKLTIHDLSNNKCGQFYRFVCYHEPGDPNSYKEIEVQTLKDDPKSFIFNGLYEYVYVYGRSVDDFHALDKNKLFTLNFSATQEIDKIQRAEKAKLEEAQIKITTLESENETLKSQVADLQSQMAAILDRLTAAGI